LRRVANLLLVFLLFGPGCRGGLERFTDAGALDVAWDAGVPEGDADASVSADEGDTGGAGDDPGDDQDAGGPGDDGDEGVDAGNTDGSDEDGGEASYPPGWTWVAGNSAQFAPPYYGDQGVPGPLNQPGGRNHCGFGRDLRGRFLLMGGFVPGNNRRNDLWRYQDGQWVWVSGSSVMNQPPVYGIQGQAGFGAVPGAVEGHASCTDESGDLWIFGGWGFAGLPVSNGETGDLWRYNEMKDWAWMAGAQAVNAAGVYGAQGTPDPAAYPGTRQYTGIFGGFAGVWLFGGYGRDSVGGRGRLSDLWFFNGTDWTWVAGSDTVSSDPASYGTPGEFDPANYPSARNYHVFARVSDGSLVYMFGGKAVDESGTTGDTNELWAFDGSQWAFVGGSKTANAAGLYGDQGAADPDNMPGARTQTVMLADPQDNLWVFGGTGYDRTGTEGSLNDLWKYDGSGWTWMAGSDLVDQPGMYPPSWNQGGDPYGPGARFSPAAWSDEQGRFWLYGGYGYDAAGTRLDLNDLWVFNPNP